MCVVARGLKLESKFNTLEALFFGGSLDIATVGNMTIIDTKDGTYKYPHHKKILFTFPNVGETLTNKGNLSCDGIMHGEADEEMSQAVDEGDVGDDTDEDDEGHHVGGNEGHDQNEPKQPSPSFDMGGSCSFVQSEPHMMKCSSNLLLTYRLS